MVGGADVGDHLLASCELYDPATGSWRAAAPTMSLRRSATYPLAHQIATRLLDGTVIVAGGITGESLSINQPAAESCRYDPGTDAWAAAPDLRTPRSSNQALLLESGKVLLFGGATETGTDRQPRGLRSGAVAQPAEAASSSPRDSQMRLIRAVFGAIPEKSSLSR